MPPRRWRFCWRSKVGAEQLRVFYALWPDAALAERLYSLGGALQQHCGGRRMRRETLHMTLAFVGEVPAGRVGLLIEAGGAVAGRAFRMDLDTLGYWARKRIVWAGCSQTPDAASRLAGDVAAALLARGFEIEKRSFLPHVTLLRNAGPVDTGSEGGETNWACTEFVLVASQRSSTGAFYRRLAAWALDDDGTAA